MEESITELAACLENTTIKSFETPLETQLEAQLGLNWADYLALSPNNGSLDMIPQLEPILNSEENKTPSNSNEFFETVDLAEDEEEYEEPVHKHQLTSIGKQPSPLEEQERKRRIEESERKRVEQRLDDQLQLIIKRNRNPSAEDLVYLENALLKKESLLPPRIMKSMSPPVYNLHHNLINARGIPGMTTSASTGSLSSLNSDDILSSCDESEMSSGYTSSELDEMDGLAKKYRQPITMRAHNLTIGSWSLKDSLKSEEWFSLEIKFLFGRRKIKYEINNRSKSKANLVMEYAFSQINGLDIKNDKRTLTIELAEPPIFASKEKGKASKISDFTDGNATTHPRHIIEILSINFEECMDRIRTCDRRLRQLAKQGINYPEGNFNSPVIETISPVSASNSNSSVICDWDNENVAVFHCEECSQNYCAVCDDVLHRHTNKKGHERVPLEDASSSPKTKKNKKRKKSDRCRCGTGATKGTLGEPCTGNRCPCFSNGRSCDNCGCKNCANPIKPKPTNGRPSMNSALHVPSLIVSATANAAAVNRLAPPVITQLASSPSRHIRHVSM